jgi:hypothetical protein
MNGFLTFQVPFHSTSDSLKDPIGTGGARWRPRWAMPPSFFLEYAGEMHIIALSTQRKKVFYKMCNGLL